MNKWKQEGQLKKYCSGSSVITYIIKSPERFLHFTFITVADIQGVQGVQ